MKKVDAMSPKEQEALVFDLVSAFTFCRSVDEVTTFLQDLLTLNEMKILAKRLRIARLLLEGVTYEQVEQSTHVSHGTVAKIAAWLAERGDGFRRIVSKLPREQKSEPSMVFDWDRYKRKHALYFWPELLLEEIVKTANKKQKTRIKEVLEKLEDKNELHKKLEKLIT